MSRCEYCCLCDDPTGRAGRGDDSIFREIASDSIVSGFKSGDEIGPLCSRCNYELEQKGAVIE